MVNSFSDILILLFVPVFIFSAIFLYFMSVRHKIFDNRSKLPNDVNTNVEGMLIELKDKGFQIDIRNESIDGRYFVKISNNEFQYNEVKEYIYQVKDYLELYNYKNKKIIYSKFIQYKGDIWISENSYYSLSKTDNIDNVTDNKINFINITFEIDMNFLDRMMFSNTTENTGAR